MDKKISLAAVHAMASSNKMPEYERHPLAFYAWVTRGPETAWSAVVDVLNQIDPGWSTDGDPEESAFDKACKFIIFLAELPFDTEYVKHRINNKVDAWATLVGLAYRIDATWSDGPQCDSRTAVENLCRWIVGLAGLEINE